MNRRDFLALCLRSAAVMAAGKVIYSFPSKLVTLNVDGPIVGAHYDDLIIDDVLANRTFADLLLPDLHKLYIETGLERSLTFASPWSEMDALG